MFKIGLESSIRNHIFKEIICNPTKYDGGEQEEIQQVQDIILGYYSLQVRAVVQKKGTMNNFDLFILSCKINSGLWASQIDSEEFDDFQFHVIENFNEYCDA